MGGLRKKMPLTYWHLPVGALGDRRLPLVAGFFSKDEILLAALGTGTRRCSSGSGCSRRCLTAFYMFAAAVPDLLRRVPRATHEAEHHVHESPGSMLVPLVVLAAGLARGRGLPCQGARTLRRSRCLRLPEPHRCRTSRGCRLVARSRGSSLGHPGRLVPVPARCPTCRAAARAAAPPALRLFDEQVLLRRTLRRLRPPRRGGGQRRSCSGSSVDAGVIDGAVNGVGDRDARLRRDAAAGPDRLRARTTRCWCSAAPCCRLLPALRPWSD